jgi:hypothetical protein
MIKLGMAVPVLALIAGLAHADDYLSPTNERVRLSLGFMYVSSSTDFRVDSSSGVTGTVIDGENEFGLDSKDFEPKFQAMVRAGERHRVFFDYFTLDRTGERTLVNGPVIFRDVVLDTGDPVETDLSLRTLGISYGYSFIHRERFELAFTLGIHDTDISTRARVSTLTRHIDQTEDVAGPLPTAGFDATYVVSKRFYFDGRGSYIKAHVSHFDGSLGFYEFDALYRLRPNISFALGYNLVKANLSSTKIGDTGYFDFDTKGPELFVRVAF